VLDVKILDYPTHAASLPGAIIPNCAATRHAHFTLDGSGAAARSAGPSLVARRALVTGTRIAPRRRQCADAGRGRELEAGRSAAAERRILTGRDAAHKRIADMLARGEALPVVHEPDHLLRRPRRSGPRRSRRSRPDDGDADGQVPEMMLAKTGLIAMIGKAERGPVAIDAIRRHRAT
jgi:fumarate hydratase class I